MVEEVSATGGNDTGSGSGSGNGGAQLAEVLVEQGVRHLFTLCGGHISPILVEAKRRGIAIVDVRDEAAAAFAADAVSRLTGVPGVAAVTAGPGVTNTVTAVKNAQLAQSPLVLLGGATATLLRGRGALQDIDQMALLRPHVKFATAVERVRDLGPVLTHAFAESRSGVPGPVFVETPVDLLYDAALVRTWYSDAAPKGSSPIDRATRWYIERHARKTLAMPRSGAPSARRSPAIAPPLRMELLERAAQALERAERPVLVLGSLVVADVENVAATAAAIERLGIPVYLAGGARGLLGTNSSIQVRHARRQALKDSDCVLLAGVPCDFRLDYGRHIRRSATYIALHRSAEDLRKNRRPTIPLLADPGEALRALADLVTTTGGGRLTAWRESLRARDDAREAEIDAMGAADLGGVNPVRLCREIDRALDEDSVIVADGGDFVGTAAYTLRPRGPLRWLDPGPFGTLGVGGGFAIGAKAARPSAEVWVIWGDGSCAYSLAEFDTAARCGLPFIGVVGNDASWAQIARDQVEILGDAVGTQLRSTDYHRVAEAYGGKGIEVRRDQDVPAALAEAKSLAASGHAVLVNVHLGRSEFRKGSLSI